MLTARAKPQLQAVLCNVSGHRRERQIISFSDLPTQFTTYLVFGSIYAEREIKLLTNVAYAEVNICN